MSVIRTLCLGGAIVGGVIFFLGAQAFPAAEPVPQAVGKSTGPIPDLSANSWSVVGGTQMNPIPGYDGPGPIIDKPGYKYKRGVVNRVADTTNPILQPWARKSMDDANAKVIAGGIPFVPTSRCWPGGVPGLLFYPADVFFVQTPKVVYYLNGRYEMRRIFMNVPHSKNPGYSWYGESVGHYENGDTLVVDTIGLDDKGPIDRYRTPHTRQLHVIERFKIVDGGKNLNVNVTVDDPGTFTTSWKGQVVMEAMHGPEGEWEEAICAENNTDYLLHQGEMVPMPHADKPDF